jgi:alkyl hydroperoxide reductase subunit D
MSIESLKARLPDYAKDLKLNLGTVLTAPGLTQRQAWGTALASAIAARNPEVIAAIESEAGRHLDPTALNAARAAAAIMAMTNIYYRFTHLVSAKDYASMPAKLRMTVIANPGVDAVDFELWSLAVSAINGCGQCIDAHERQVTAKGASRETVQNVIRIAAVIIHAIAVTLNAEPAASARAA